jgi:cellulose synthase/poly-beta-1,6-N-acetylglucosamine synthase-like glycosyltransferase
MANDVVHTIFVAAICIYMMRSIIFWCGIQRERIKNSRQVTNSHPRVSVIVPARNEEANIERCVRSVMANTYRGEFELIVVNDRSSDRTGTILAGLQRKFPALIVHNTVESENDGQLRGKPRALHQGIEASKGDIVMMTDADCTVDSQWIQTITQFFTEKVGLVPSFTMMEPHNGFEKLQTLEWVFNHTLARAGIGLGQPLGCFGNNLSIRRSVYEEIGGYTGIKFSVTEDLALQQAVARTRWEIQYPCVYEGRVITLPVRSFGSFLRQHQRWAKGGQALGWRATIFVLSSAALWLGILATILAAEWEWLCILLVQRILADLIIIFPSLRELRLMYLWPWFPLALPFFLCIEFVIPFFLLKKNVVWKGQTFA